MAVVGVVEMSRHPVFVVTVTTALSPLPYEAAAPPLARWLATEYLFRFSWVVSRRQLVGDLPERRPDHGELPHGAPGQHARVLHGREIQQPVHG